DLSGSYKGSGSVTVSPNAATKGTRITGTGTFLPSFGQGSYQVHFCFDTANAFVQAKYHQTTGGSLAYTTLNSTATFTAQIGSNNLAGVLLGYAPATATAKTLGVRMGISWTSTAKACAFAEEEIPDISAFDAIQIAARAKWNEVLGTVQVDSTGVSSDTQQLFWTSLYRTYISPTNITGDNPLWVSTEPYWDSFYCIWCYIREDTRLILLQGPLPRRPPALCDHRPTAQAQVVRALIDIYRHTGWLPDCRMSLDKGFTQGGSNADSLLSDSFVKGIKAGIDWETGYEAMVKDATVEGDFGVQGRGGITSRAKLGFIPVND
ncbi:glycosyl hydrolase family 92-domain-containing protein, partial [Mycena pura]